MIPINIKGCDEDGRITEFFKRVGGCCKPITKFSNDLSLPSRDPK